MTHAKQRHNIVWNCDFIVVRCKICIPERDGDKHLTLTAAVTHRFHTEAAIFGRYHFVAGIGGCLISQTDLCGLYQQWDLYKTEVLYIFSYSFAQKKVFWQTLMNNVAKAQKLYIILQSLQNTISLGCLKWLNVRLGLDGKFILND